MRVYVLVLSILVVYSSHVDNVQVFFVFVFSNDSFLEILLLQ